MVNTPEIQTRIRVMIRRRKIALILILLADGAYILWGGMAALLPEHLLGPDSAPILSAEYEGFTSLSWSELIATTPRVANFMTILFRMYGIYCLIFGMLTVWIAVCAFRRGESWAWWALLISNTIAYGTAMTFDRVVNAIGMFEMTEYLGIVVVYVALGMTAPFLAGNRPAQ